MRATSEFIKWDDEDRGNADYEEGAYPFGIHQFQKDHMLFLCYYEPNKPPGKQRIIEEYVLNQISLFLCAAKLPRQ